MAAIKHVAITSIDSSYSSTPVDWDKILPPEKTKGDQISEGQSRAAARKGYHGQIPYGYKKTKTGIVIDPETASYVHKMFDRCAEGKTNSEIAKELDDLGVLTPTGNKGWLEDTIHHILSNPIYYGALQINKNRRGADRILREPKTAPRILEDNHEAIVDRETFDRAQSVLAGRSRKNSTNVNEYGKMARCKVCGHALEFVAMTPANRRTTAIFRCRNHTGSNPKGQKLDNTPALESEEMNRKVMDYCNDYVIRVATLVGGYELIHEQLDWEREVVESHIRNLGSEQMELVRETNLTVEEKNKRAMDICEKYGDILTDLFTNESETVELEMMYLELTAAFGKRPISLYQDSFDIEKVKKLLNQIELNPDGSIEVEYKKDISQYVKQYIEQ